MRMAAPQTQERPSRLSGYTHSHVPHKVEKGTDWNGHKRGIEVVKQAAHNSKRVTKIFGCTDIVRSLLW